MQPCASPSKSRARPSSTYAGPNSGEAFTARESFAGHGDDLGVAPGRGVVEGCVDLREANAGETDGRRGAPRRSGVMLLRRGQVPPLERGVPGGQLAVTERDRRGARGR